MESSYLRVMVVKQENVMVRGGIEERTEVDRASNAMFDCLLQIEIFSIRLTTDCFNQ